jgi:hypothetical protein
MYPRGKCCHWEKLTRLLADFSSMVTWIVGKVIRIERKIPLY